MYTYVTKSILDRSMYVLLQSRAEMGDCLYARNDQNCGLMGVKDVSWDINIDSMSNPLSVLVMVISRENSTLVA